jgi:SP family xylose:H+ symportor-like MFS transporter
LNALFNHGFPYWTYGVMSFLAAAFVYFYVPETKQRTLEDIQNLWTRDGARAAVIKQPAAG